MLALADVLPCRILGDPLQGIFDFGQNRLIDWRRDVVAHFERLPELDYPWRWDSVLEFGRWLLSIRPQFSIGGQIDLSKAPKTYVKWVRSADKARSLVQRVTCKDVWDALGADENGVGVLDWAPQCHRLVRTLGPHYSIVEPIDCSDLTKACQELAARKGLDRVDVLVEFAAACLTRVKGELKPVVLALRSGKVRKGDKCKEQYEALASVASQQSLAPLIPALESLRKIPRAKFVRRELFREMCHSLEAYAGGAYDTLADAAWHVRNRTSRAGRRYGRMIISRTVLIKGLEFDHAVVLDADSMDAHDLYVAMTRGSRSLTVLSKTPVLHLKTAKNGGGVTEQDHEFKLVPLLGR